MTRGRAQSRWPILQLLVAGALVTALALVAISRLQVEANIYGLLGQDDPEVAKVRCACERHTRSRRAPGHLRAGFPP